MPSRDNALRVHLERALRVLALTALAFAAWNAARPPLEPGAETSDHASLRDALERWTTEPPRSAHLELERAPGAAQRDWIRALRRAGTPITWENASIPALAIEAAPVVDPRGGAMIWLVSPSNERVVVADGIAPIDTVVMASGGAMLNASIGIDPFGVRLDAHGATARLRDTILLRRILVIGRATWEAKFVITALEEAGWTVDARLAVAPGVDVTQGAPNAPDTARHAAVIVLAPPPGSLAAAVARYVRAGGGLILAGEGAEASSLMAIAAGRPASRRRPAAVTFVADAPRRALALRPLTPRNDALVLEEQEGRAVIAARRVESGRVVQVGYEDTWRWRLAGGANAVAAHRDWWNGLVAAAAYRAVKPIPSVGPNEQAPLAALVGALGPPAREARSAARARGWRPSPGWLFSLIIVLLLAEIASRRLRGAP